MHQAAGALDVQMATRTMEYRVANIGDLIRRAFRSPRIRNPCFEGTVGLRPVAGPFRVTPDALRKLSHRQPRGKRKDSLLREAPWSAVRSTALDGLSRARPSGESKAALRAALQGASRKSRDHGDCRTGDGTCSGGGEWRGCRTDRPSNGERSEQRRLSQQALE